MFSARFIFYRSASRDAHWLTLGDATIQ